MATIRTARQIGLAVRQQRKTLGLTQKQLAAAAGVSERLVIALELGDATSIRIDKLLPILQPLGLSLSINPQRTTDNGHDQAANASNIQFNPEDHMKLYDEAFAKATAHIKPSLQVQKIIEKDQ